MILAHDNPLISLMDLGNATVSQVYDALEMLQVKGFLDKQKQEQQK